MPGKIFYRVRKQSESGVEQPRFQWVAHAGANLEIYGKHLRLVELKFIAEVVGAELLMLPADSPCDKDP